MNFKMASLLIFPILFFACASGFQKVEPQSFPYSNNYQSEGVNFSYKYNVLAESGNKRYANKEQSSLVKMVAVKIENNTEKEINVQDDITFMMNNHPVSILPPSRIQQEIKQGTLGYLFYLLLTPLQVYKTDSNGTSSFPIGLILGPGITILNLSKAANANNSLEKTIEKNNILNKSIKPGETVHGFLCIQSGSYDPITIKVIPEFISENTED